MSTSSAGTGWNWPASKASPWTTSTATSGPDVDDAITHTVTAAIWFGITTGYLTLTGSYHIPRKYLYR